MRFAVDHNDLGGSSVDLASRAIARHQVISRIATATSHEQMAQAIELLVKYVGGSHYMLAREDLVKESGLNFIVTSDWPFDLVRRLAVVISNDQNRSSEMEKCLSLLKPRIYDLPDDVVITKALDRKYCSLVFCVGRIRFSLLLLFPEDSVPSDDKLREAALLTSYLASFGLREEITKDRDIELTERELECLFWIAEGKTSDEMAMILGISRNTINNYITSVMRKTATKTRSEAIAYAVRNNLV